MTKTNSRSFRYDDKVKEIMENFPGNNLSEKFDNLIRYCFYKVPETEKHLKELDKEIVKKRKTLQDVSQQVQQIETLMRELEGVKSSIKQVSKHAEAIVKNNL